MFVVSAIYIYPVKSLGGISIAEGIVTETGFQHDRRWMLVDKEGKFLTQRQLPSMALLQTTFTANGLSVYHKQIPGKNIAIPFLTSPVRIKKVRVWKDECDVWVYGNMINAWFSETLNLECELVYMPDVTRRLVDTDYAKENEITSFSDAFPFLIIGQSSLDEMNARLREPLSMNRFRPNIVFTSGFPNEEDNWKHFTIDEVDFFGVKTCARCIITTIDQQTAESGMEPLRTLTSYRKIDNKVKFGINLLHKGSGVIRTGDIIHVKDA
jgi:uncharacterized protein YcbX